MFILSGQRKFILSWILATIVGLSVGVLLWEIVVDIAWNLERSIEQATSIRFPFSLQATIGFATFGVSIGFCQWLVLRNSLNASWKWIILSMIAFPFVFVGLDPILHSSNGPFIIQGIAISIFQWLYLRTQLRKAYLWIVSSAITWGLISLIIYLLPIIPIPATAYPVARVLVLLLIGLCLSLPTGLMMLWLFRNRSEIKHDAS